VRVVLDTTVVVAATRSNRGASRLLLRGALEKRFALLLSVPLALEYESVLKRPEQLAVSGGTMLQIDKLISALNAVAIPVHRAFLRSPLLRDPNDEMVLETALGGEAHLLVTFNRKDFGPVASNGKFRVVAPAEALREIRRNDEEE
jgi:putative PIN family toxin of toxin-antitoxin system